MSVSPRPTRLVARADVSPRYPHGSTRGKGCSPASGDLPGTFPAPYAGLRRSGAEEDADETISDLLGGFERFIARR